MEKNIQPEAIQNENEIILQLVKEMTPWAEHSIQLYKCFTINGI